MSFDIAQLIAIKYQDKYPRVTRFLEEDRESILTFYDYPDIHQRKFRTNNPIEGLLNKALKQGSKVVKVFPQPRILSKICLLYIDGNR